MKLPPGHVPGGGPARKATAYGGLGETLLRRLGWQAGQGLGAAKQGISAAIEVKKKKDGAGLGSGNRPDGSKKWWEDAFDEVAGRLCKGADGSATSDESCEEGLGTNLLRADANASASSAEATLATELAQHPWGHFGGRQGKLERIRRQEALAACSTSSCASKAVINLKADDAEVPLKRMKPAEARSQAEAAVASGKASVWRKKAKQHKRLMGEASAEPRKKRKKEPAEMSSPLLQGDAAAGAGAGLQVAQSAGIAPGTPVKDFVAEPQQGWWGAKRFVSAGCLEGLQEEPSKHQSRQVFDEDTQAQLYLAAHAAKTANKTGLGKGRAAGQLKGHTWQGSRMRFADDDASQPAPVETCPTSISIQTLGLSGPNQDIRRKPLVGAKRVIRKKLVLNALREGPPEGMSLKRLQKALLEAVSAEHGPQDFSHDQLRSIIVQKVQGSPEYIIKGKKVLRAP